MHSVEALPQAYSKYMKKKMRPIGRIFTYMSLGIEIVVVFLQNDV